MALDKLALIMALLNNGNSVDLSNYYTKTEADQHITEKVAEIVANAPEDFDTLKEISDWITDHAESAAAMNSAIAANTAAINNKVDKVAGKQLSTNDFTNDLKTKLDSLENYDDTAVKSGIAVNKTTLGYQTKNLLKVTATTQTINGVTMTVNPDGSLSLSGTAAARAVIPINNNKNRASISELPAQFILSGGDQMLGVECCIGIELSTGTNSGYVASFYDGDNGRAVDLSDYPTAKCWYAYMRIYEGVNVDGITIYPMIRPLDIKNPDFEPYAPSLMDHISNLEKRIAALETAIAGENE